jgi:hypothetical protein
MENMWFLLAWGAPQIPWDSVDPDYRDAARRIVERPTLSADIPAEEVRSAPEVYEFLLDRLPFTAAVVRAAGCARYDVWTEEMLGREPPADEAEAERWRRTYYLDDGEGMALRAVRIYHEGGLWVYYTYGTYSAPPLPRIAGWSVIRVWYERRGDVLVTEAQVDVVLGSLPAAVARAMPDTVRGIIRRKSAVFVDAAKWVAEAARDNPEQVCRIAASAPDVRAGEIEEFRRAVAGTQDR